MDTWTLDRFRATQDRIGEHAKQRVAAQQRATGKTKLVDWLRNKGYVG